MVIYASSICFSFFSFFIRAIFYNRNDDAAKTQASAKKGEVGTGSSMTLRRASYQELFPIQGWSSKPSDLPVVTAATVLGHLMRTGKSVCSSDDGSVVNIVQKPLRRGHDFFREISA